MALFKSLVLGLFIYSPLFTYGDEPTSSKVDECPPSSSRVAQLIENMSTEDKIGQLLLIGFNGNNFSKDISSKIKTIKPGGIIFFRHNIKSAYQVAQLNERIFEESKRNQKAPPFLAVDQEGGSVTRIHLDPPMPSAEVMGITNDVERSQKLGQKTGDILYKLGFNMNLAPVVEVAKPGRSTFLRSRVFSNNTSTVTKLGGSFAAGLMQSKIVPTYKHFPSHGITKKDPHKVAPKLLDRKEDLITNRAQSFQNLISKNLVPSLMLAHVRIPNIEPKLPLATYSPTLIKDILRNDLEYCGVIITDDIEMEGAKNTLSSAERAKLAIIAGSDMVMVAWNKKAQKNTFDSLLNAFIYDEISMNRLNASVKRILNLKEKFGILDKEFSANLSSIKHTMEDPEYKTLVSSIYRDARSVVENRRKNKSIRKPANFNNRKGSKDGRTRRDKATTKQAQSS